MLSGEQSNCSPCISLMSMIRAAYFIGNIHAISSRNVATDAENTLLDWPETERKTDTRDTESPIVSKNDAKAIPMLSPKLSSIQMEIAYSKKIRAFVCIPVATFMIRVKMRAEMNSGMMAKMLKAATKVVVEYLLPAER